MRESSTEAGLDKVDTEEEAAALFQRILTASFHQEGTNVRTHCEP